MEGLLILVVIAALVAVVVVTSRNGKRKAIERQRAELEPVRKLTAEDITALGEELQALDLDLVGRELGPGENADYQRALDAYESAKTAADAMSRPSRAVSGSFAASVRIVANALGSITVCAVVGDASNAAR